WHATEGLAGRLRDRTERVPRRAGERTPSAPGEIRQPGALQLPVRICVELITGARASRDHGRPARFPRTCPPPLAGRARSGGRMPAVPRCRRFFQEAAMQYRIHNAGRIACAVLLSVSFAALAASAFAAEYKMTVNRDRLVNAQNEPQNWLMMNGDYGS